MTDVTAPGITVSDKTAHSWHLRPGKVRLSMFAVAQRDCGSVGSFQRVFTSSRSRSAFNRPECDSSQRWVQISVLKSQENTLVPGKTFAQL